MMKTHIHKIISVLCLLMFTSAMMAQVRIVSSTNPEINSSDGSITIEARGSAAPFIIQLIDDTGEIVSASDGDFISGEWIFDGLLAGSYRIIAFDKTGCELSLGDITLSEEERCSLEIIVTNLVHSSERGLGPCPAEGITGDNISADGAIDVHIAGADGPISYAWQGSYGFSSTDQNISDLRPGSYVLTVTVGECSATAVVLVSACTLRYGCDRTDEVAQVDMPEIIFGESVSPDNGQASGRASIDPAIISILDLAGYQYYWQDQTGNYYSSPSLDGLASGVYCFHILDGCGGHDQACVELYDCSVDPITIDALNECTDPRYGQFEVVLSGGQNPSIIETIVVGNSNTYIAEDERGCRVEHTFILAEIEEWNASIEVLSDVTLLGDAIISVSLDATIDYAPYVLYVGGSRYELSNNNGSNEITLNGLDGGSYTAFIENNLGCRINVDFELADCDDSTELNVQPSYIVDGGNATIYPPVRNQCDGTIQMNLSISGGSAPYSVSAQEIGTTDGWSYDDSFDAELESASLGVLPNNPILLIIVDACGTTYSEELRFCNHCDFSYNVYNQGFEIGSLGSITIDVDNACGGMDFPFLGEGTDIEVTYSESLLQDWEFPITITWPDGRGTYQIYLDENGDIQTTGSSEIELDTDNPDDLGSFEVIIERADGCSLTLPFEISDGETYAHSFITVGGQGIDLPEFDDLIIGTEHCRSCNPAPSIPGSDDCNGRTEWFTFEPNDPSDPCGSGGTLTYNWEGNSSTQSLSYTIDVDVSDIVGSIDNLGLGQLNNPYCIDGGGCIINDLLGTRGIPLLVSVCNESFTNSDDCNGTCPEGEICHLGQCRPICDVNYCDDLCQFTHTQGSGDDSFYFNHDLEIGSTVRIYYTTGGAHPNSIIISGGLLAQLILWKLAPMNMSIST